MTGVEGLQGELPVSWLSAPTSLRYVWIVPTHGLGLEHFQLGVDSLEFRLMQVKKQVSWCDLYR